jgi:hypothetical protein
MRLPRCCCTGDTLPILRGGTWRSGPDQFKHDLFNDLLAFAVPTPVLYAGRAFSQVVSQFTSGPVETAAYLGPGFWIILVLYTESSWSTHTGRFLIVSLLLIGLMSLGPTLHIDGISRGPAAQRPGAS